MTPEAQRIAIAETCGWKIVVHLSPKHPMLGEHEKFACAVQVPDYLSDLNAMHEAEKVLTPNQHYDYTGRLERTIDGFCATAAQRAEAFLRTLNLWKDSPVPDVNQTATATVRKQESSGVAEETKTEEVS